MNFNEAFNKNPMIGILRGVDRGQTTDAIQASIDGGATCVEITMNTPGALTIINLVRAYFNTKCCLGAGTVLTLNECREAIDAGAQFIVCPNAQPEIIDYCKKNNTAVIPGALTPSEIYAAWKAGASLVKVFPVGNVGGHEYIRELRGPFMNIPLVAVGGVSIDKVDDYFRAGVNGIGLGQKLFASEWIKEKNFRKITEAAEAFTKAIAKNRPKEIVTKDKFTDLLSGNTK